MDKERKVVSIDVYDDDGQRRMGIIGTMTARGIRDEMRKVLEEDGIPVLRERPANALHIAAEEAANDLDEKGSIKICWKCGKVEFRAEGPAEDVVRAQEEFVDALIALAEGEEIFG